MSDPALGHYRPWLEDVRRYKPYQLEDRVEQLFHEKSVTAYSAWNRQFDATIADLRFKVGGKPLAIEPTLNLLVDRSGEKRKAAAEALAHTFRDNVRDFALITNTLAKDKEISDRWRGFADIADERHLVEPGRARSRRCAGLGGARRLSAAVAPLLCAQGKMVRQKAAAALGPQRAAAAGADAHRRLGRGQGYRARGPMARSRRKWRRSPNVFSPSAGSMRRCGRARRRARSRIRQRRRRIPMCCSTTRASRAT